MHVVPEYSFRALLPIAVGHRPVGNLSRRVKNSTVAGQVTSSKFMRYCRVATRYDKRAAAFLGLGLDILLTFVA
jgi:hypothetical protein